MSDAQPASVSPHRTGRQKLSLVATVVMAIATGAFVVTAIRRGDLATWAYAGFYAAITFGSLVENTTVRFIEMHSRKLRIVGGVAAFLGAVAAFASGAGGFVVFLGVVNVVIGVLLVVTPPGRGRRR